MRNPNWKISFVLRKRNIISLSGGTEQAENEKEESEMKFGEKIKALRAERDLSQPELAKMVGVSTRTINGYENDNRYPRKRELYDKLAEALGVEPGYLTSEMESFEMEAYQKYGAKGLNQAKELEEAVVGLYAGGTLKPEEMDAMMSAISAAYFKAKEAAKKYTPKKYRNQGDDDAE